MSQKDSMTAQAAEVKRITLRWPDDLWEEVTIESTKLRTSVQTLATEAVKLFLSLPDIKRQRIIRQAESGEDIGSAA